MVYKIFHYLVMQIRRYDSATEIAVPNLVTSILASYRGYDTFGETTVIFTAGIGVLMLLGRGGKKKKGLLDEAEEKQS